VGGEARPGEPLARAERLDARTGGWAPAGLGGPPASARTRHTATRIEGPGPWAGLVLVAGGQTGGVALASAEVYDPVADRFALAAGPMLTARAGHTATPLPDGRVLLLGGVDAHGEPLASGELFDPATGTFAPASGAWLAVSRAYHTATRLADGRVLVTGGRVSPEGTVLEATAVAELLTPAPPESPWATATVPVPMAGARAAHTATAITLADGREVVLLAGGSSHLPELRALADAEVFDPAATSGAGGFSALAATMASPRSGHTATLMADGRTVLVIGGATAPHPELCPVTVGIERCVPDALGVAPPGTLYGGLPATALFVQPLAADGTPVGLPETAQGLTAHAAVALGDGRVLVVGGADCAFAAPVAVTRVAVVTESASR
jgi:hypothetical protein